MEGNQEIIFTLKIFLSVPRRDHGAAVFGEFLYVVGGWNMEPYYTSTERFHLGSRTWSQGRIEVFDLS